MASRHTSQEYTMALNARAQPHYDTIVPNHVSTLAVTDPELIEIFNNVAFGEVLRASALDVRTRLMVQLEVLAERGSRCRCRTSRRRRPRPGTRPA
jgi:hypothetical protein